VIRGEWASEGVSVSPCSMSFALLAAPELESLIRNSGASPLPYFCSSRVGPVPVCLPGLPEPSRESSRPALLGCEVTMVTGPGSSPISTTERIVVACIVDPSCQEGAEGPISVPDQGSGLAKSGEIPNIIIRVGKAEFPPPCLLFPSPNLGTVQAPSPPWPRSKPLPPIYTCETVSYLPPLIYQLAVLYLSPADRAEHREATVRTLRRRPVTSLEKVKALPGVGAARAEKIMQIFPTFGAFVTGLKSSCHDTGMASLLQKLLGPALYTRLLRMFDGSSLVVTKRSSRESQRSLNSRKSRKSHDSHESCESHKLLESRSSKNARCIHRTTTGSGPAQPQAPGKPAQSNALL